MAGKGSFKLSIGADPELFLRDKKTGLFISAHDKLPGTKLAPHEVFRGAVQVDGVAAEFNITPSLNRDEFVLNIDTVYKKLQDFVGADIELVAEPTVTFSHEYFKSLPESATELGCNPDFDAWTGQVNPKPDGDSTTMRTGAGHVHIGWTDGVDPTDTIHIDDCRIVAKQLDYYLGLYSLMWDKDDKRRSLYGRAGAFRPKPYGVEYRSLSNMWLRTPKLWQWVFDTTWKACNDLIANNHRLEDTFGGLAQRVINENITWWTPAGAEKGGKEVVELYRRLAQHTGLNDPPKIPVPQDPAKEVKKATPRKFWRSSTGRYFVIGTNGQVDWTKPSAASVPEDAEIIT